MSVRVVGFDGTPVPGGSGARTAIFDAGDSDLATSGRRRVSRREFERLADEGYVTRVDLDAAGTDRVVVYRTAMPWDRELMHDGLRWSASGDYEVAALTRDESVQVLTDIAKSRRIRAMLAWEAGRHQEAVRRAREGLMAVPGLRTSMVAAQLYGVLYADAFGDGARLPLVLRELKLTLDPPRLLHAISTGHDLRFARIRAPRSRLVEQMSTHRFELA